MQLLVAVVDAELFEGVGFEELKASNIEDADVIDGVSERDAVVDASDNVVEETTVDGFAQGISRGTRLSRFETDSAKLGFCRL